MFCRSICVCFGLASLALSFEAVQLSADEPAKPQAEEQFVNVLGDEFKLPGPDDGPATVLIFFGHECPISNTYSPEIGRLAKEFAPKKVTFCVVYAESELSEEDARTHARDYKFPCAAILDPKLTLAKRCGAKVKPEAAILSSTGELLYLGRIDDRYTDFGKRREQPSNRNLRDALLEVLAGKPVTNARTKAIGCDIDFPGESQ
jgi:thiol-disulfide isomerase/thioredoxin